MSDSVKPERSVFIFHLGVIAALFGYFGGLYVWLVRAFVTGGVAERIMTSVVIPLLTVILVTIASTLWTIAWEGRKFSSRRE